MQSLEEFLEAEIEEFESPEFQAALDQLSTARRNNVLFKRLLFDYDEELKLALKKFRRSNGTEPPWPELISSFPELKYIIADPSTPLDIVKMALKEISLDQDAK